MQPAGILLTHPPYQSAPNKDLQGSLLQGFWDFPSARTSTEKHTPLFKVTPGQIVNHKTLQNTSASYLHDLTARV